MEKKDCFFIGSIFKLHGYKGKIILFNENDISLNFEKIKYLLIEKEGILIPFFVEKISSYKSNNFLIEFEDIKNEDEAKKLLNSNVFTSYKLIYENTEVSLEKKIIGFKIIDKQFGDLGKIQTINNHGKTFKLCEVINEPNWVDCQLLEFWY